jgi:hypothetical protein
MVSQHWERVSQYLATPGKHWETISKPLETDEKGLFPENPGCAGKSLSPLN